MTEQTIEYRTAAERAEAARVAALQTRIDAIRQWVLAVAHRDAAAIRLALDEARAFELDPDEFAERWPDATKAIGEVWQALETLLAEREAREAEEAARLKAREEELDRQRAELDRLRAERERLMEPVRRKAKAEAQRQAELAELDRLRAERERRKAEAEARKPAEADPLAEIKDALAAGTLTGPEAIDRAYRLGFEAGERAARLEREMRQGRRHEREKSDEGSTSDV